MILGCNDPLKATLKAEIPFDGVHDFSTHDSGSDRDTYRVSEQSTQLFRRFIQGYVRGAPPSREGQTAQPTVGAVEAVVGEVHVDRSDSPSSRGIGSHYRYFTNISRDECGLSSREEHASRLERARAHMERDRAIMNSWKDAEKKSKQKQQGLPYQIS